jgi:iron complex outermembrane receptor protein
MNSRKSVKTALLCGTMLAASAAAFGAQAQEAARPAPAPRQNTIQEVVVTGQRRTQQLENVPASITAVSPQELQRSGVTNTTEINRLVAGVQINAAGFATQPAIRGITSLTNGTNIENNVAVYVDGFYTPSATDINMGLANVAGIEVLKGPQGALYGRNATGGAILITTLKPSTTLTGRFEGTYARFDDKRLSAYLSGPFTDRFRGSVAAFWRDTDGYIPKVDPADTTRTKGDAAPIKQEAVRVKLQGDLTDDLVATLGLNYSMVDDPRGILFSGFDHVPAAIPLSVRARKFGTAAFNGDNQNMVLTREATLTLEHNSSIGTLTSRTGYAQRINKLSFDPDGTFLNSVYSVGKQPQDTFQQSIDYEIKAIDKLNLIVGGLYYHDRIETENGFPLFLSGALATVNSFNQKTEAAAIYFDATYDLTDKLSLNFGGRYSYEEKKFSFVTVSGAGAVIFPFTEDHEIWRKFTPKATIRYEFAPRTSVYASYSQGFRSGNYNASGAPVPALLVPTRPEEITAYEVGFKTARSRMRFDTAAFYYDYTDINVSVTVPNPLCPAGQTCNAVTLFSNAKAAEVYGVDAQLTLMPIDNLNVRIGAAWVHARYTDFDNATGTGVNATNTANVSGQAQDWTDQQMARAPNFTANLGLDYDIENVFGGRLTLSGNYNYTDSYVINNASLYGPLFPPRADMQRFRQGAFSLVSIQATWHDSTDHYWVTAFANNLFDKTYRMLSSGGGFGDYSVPGEPQVYGVKVGYQF